MADPFGTNMTSRAASIADVSDPNFASTKLAQRVRQLRTDVDAVNADAASTTAVLAALAAADGDIAVNKQKLTNVNQIIGRADADLIINTGASARSVKIQGDGVNLVVANEGKLGFFNETPVAQQGDCGVGGNAAANAAAIALVRTCLQNLGLMA